MVALNTLLYRRDRLIAISLLGCLRVNTLDVRVWRCHSGVSQLFRRQVGQLFRTQLVSVAVEDAGSGFVTRLELNFTLQGLDLFRIKDSAVLVAVLDTFLTL